MQDYDIVRQCIEGNTEAFAELVERYQRLVFSVALQYLKDAGRAEDAVQETFTKAYIHLRSYNPDYKFSTWITKIAYHCCIDMLRKQRETNPLDEALETADKTITPEEAVVSRDRVKKLETLINQLEPKYRQPLMLFHASGLKYEEIAEILKQPMSIVKNRIYRARKMLKEALKDY
jgi:RNA polymerase sigma-70 factor (ECF subfamily)